MMNSEFGIYHVELMREKRKGHIPARCLNDTHNKFNSEFRIPNSAFSKAPLWNQWWNRRMPVKAMTMLYRLQVSMTLSSRMEPPGWAT